MAEDAGARAVEEKERARQASPYEEALACLSSLITRRTRADGANKGDRFDLLFDYLKILELEGPISQLRVIHVAGTKGKGSTCTFSESILRHCGFRTGLFTSPHLIDVRERFRLDGCDISEEKFLEYFWWCWRRLQEKTSEDVPMPTYFRFLALLAFKIFAAEKVDVAILEVGLGGKFDATNVVQAPVVCGISSLGYDHMEILGNTLREIAGEKAGILKHGVPAFTVPQPEEAMVALEEKASQLGIPLEAVPPLDARSLKGQKLGLQGEHQYANAALAVALCRAWLQRTGHQGETLLESGAGLPEQFIAGLAAARMQGRAQVVADPVASPLVPGSCTPRPLVFYLDGAHSPESMEMCAKWFSSIIREEDPQEESPGEGRLDDHGSAQQILLFNCMPQRDPRLLLPRLLNTCSDHGNPWSTPSLDLKMQILSRTAARLALFLALRFRCPLPQGHLRPEPVCVQPGGLPLAAGGRPSGGSFMAEDAPESVGEPPRRRQRFGQRGQGRCPAGCRGVHQELCISFSPSGYQVAERRRPAESARSFPGAGDGVPASGGRCAETAEEVSGAPPLSPCEKLSFFSATSPLSALTCYSLAPETSASSALLPPREIISINPS